MFAVTYSPSSPDAPVPDDLAEDLAMLRELAEIGMTLARSFARQTQRAAEDRWVDQQSNADPGKPFTNMARCVRQTLALRAKLLKDHRTVDQPDLADRDQRAARAFHRKRKALVRGAVAEFIHTTVERGDTERLLRDLDERLDDEEATEDFDTRPIGRIVVDLCDVMGVTPNTDLFSDEELGILAFDTDRPKPPPPGPNAPFVHGRKSRNPWLKEGKRPEPHPPRHDRNTPPKKIDPLPD